MMKLRLAAPEHLVDLGRIKDLNYIREAGRRAPHRRDHHASRRGKLAADCAASARCWRRRRRYIGDVQVRNHGHHRRQRGACRSVGGLSGGAAGARSEDRPERREIGSALFRRTISSSTRSPRRSSPAKSCASDRVPVEAPATGTSYQKVLQPASGFAIVGIAVRVRKQGGKITMARIGVTGLSNRAYPRDGGGEGAGRQTAASRGRDRRRRRRWWRKASMPTPICTLRPTIGMHLAAIYAARAIAAALGDRIAA